MDETLATARKGGVLTNKYMKLKESVEEKNKNLYHTVLRNSKGKVIAVVFQDKITDEIESIKPIPMGV